MKSNFALSLSFDGLRLMHRVTGGWHLVGEVALDDPDMTGALSRLRAAADQLEPTGLRTKLLIPNDQIKYLALDTTRAEDEDVRTALDGATPYAVSDLAYDFTKGGGRTYIAAVARETLDEARQFASEHGFNPTDFAAIPEPFTFVGEANFGDLTGAPVERDDEPVVVIGTAVIGLAPDAEVTPDEGQPEANPQQPGEAVASPQEQVEPEPEAEPTPDPTPEPIAVEAEGEGVSDIGAQDIAVADVTPEPEPEDLPEDLPEAAMAPQVAPEVETVPDADVAPLFTSRLRADRTEGSPAPARPQTTESTSARAEPSLSRPVPPALAVPTDMGDAGPALSAPSREADQTPAATQPILAGAPEPEAAPPITGEAATALPSTTLSNTAALSAASLTAERSADTSPSVESEGAAAKALGAVGAVGGAVGGMFASRRMAKTNTPAATQPAEQTPDTKSGRSVFGARKQAKPKPVVGGKPRFLGLILTAILLLFLLAIAAFAALSEEGLAGWFRSNDATQVAATAPETAASPAAASEVAAAPDAGDVPDPDGAANTLPEMIAPTGGQVLTPEEAQRIYAATGVWQKAPRIPLTPRTTSLEGMVVDVTARPVTRVPASPLADAGSVAGDAVIPTPVDPPAPSVTFDFDERGLVVATPQGAVTPDGIIVIAGRPSLNPPTRPGTIAPEVTPLEQLASVIPDDATTVTDAPDDVLLITGAPAVLPPARPATQATAAALASDAAPETAPNTLPDTIAIPQEMIPEGLNVVTGPPPVLPPVRPGTQAAAPADVAAAQPVPEALPAETPEGLNLIAGAPSVLPPVRPGTQAPAAPLPDVVAEEAVLSEQASPTLRPLVRPASVTQAAVVAENAPVLGALTQSQAASFRPRTRPAGIAPPPPPEPEAATEPEPVPAPAPQQAATGLQISPEIAAAVAQAAARPDPFANATRLAIPNSLRPDTRPRNMDRIVARAAQAQQRAATQVAAVAPRAVAPSGPTGGTVAQNATIESAINLREINLIGIYGGSGDRRALIRLGNGRYQRVTVGDRLDGGRVTAISANALSYDKRGRSITLQVPG